MARSLKKGPYVYHKVDQKIDQGEEFKEERGDQDLVTFFYDYSSDGRRDHRCA